MNLDDWLDFLNSRESISDISLSIYYQLWTSHKDWLWGGFRNHPLPLPNQPNINSAIGFHDLLPSLNSTLKALQILDKIIPSLLDQSKFNDTYFPGALYPYSTNLAISSLISTLPFTVNSLLESMPLMVPTNNLVNDVYDFVLSLSRFDGLIYEYPIPSLFTSRYYSIAHFPQQCQNIHLMFQLVEIIESLQSKIYDKTVNYQIIAQDEHFLTLLAKSWRFETLFCPSSKNDFKLKKPENIGKDSENISKISESDSSFFTIYKIRKNQLHPNILVVMVLIFFLSLFTFNIIHTEQSLNEVVQLINPFYHLSHAFVYFVTQKAIPVLFFSILIASIPILSLSLNENVEKFPPLKIKVLEESNSIVPEGIDALYNQMEFQYDRSLQLGREYLVHFRSSSHSSTSYIFSHNSLQNTEFLNWINKNDLTYDFHNIMIEQDEFINYVSLLNDNPRPDDMSQHLDIKLKSLDKSQIQVSSISVAHTAVISLKSFVIPSVLLISGLVLILEFIGHPIEQKLFTISFKPNSEQLSSYTIFSIILLFLFWSTVYLIVQRFQHPVINIISFPFHFTGTKQVWSLNLSSATLVIYCVMLMFVSQIFQFGLFYSQRGIRIHPFRTFYLHSTNHNPRQMHHYMIKASYDSIALFWFFFEAHNTMFAVSSLIFLALPFHIEFTTLAFYLYFSDCIFTFVPLYFLGLYILPLITIFISVLSFQFVGFFLKFSGYIPDQIHLPTFTKEGKLE